MGRAARHEPALVVARHGGVVLPPLSRCFFCRGCGPIRDTGSCFRIGGGDPCSCYRFRQAITCHSASRSGALRAVARAAPRPLLRSKWLSLALFVIASVVIRLAVREHLLQRRRKIHCRCRRGVAVRHLLLALRFDRTEGFRFARSDVHAKLASFSYTLYAFHVPVVFWLAGAIGVIFGAGWRLEHATLAHYAAAVAIILFALAAGYALSLLTEAHTEPMRRRARDLFTRRTSDAV